MLDTGWWVSPFSSSAEIEIPEGSWLIGNVDYMGFYRTNYDEAMWRRLIEQLNKDHKVSLRRTFTSHSSQFVHDLFLKKRRLVERGSLSARIFAHQWLPEVDDGGERYCQPRKGLFYGRHVCGHEFPSSRLARPDLNTNGSGIVTRPLQFLWLGAAWGRPPCRCWGWLA